jgi:hypothetical protein
MCYYKINDDYDMFFLCAIRNHTVIIVLFHFEDDSRLSSFFLAHIIMRKIIIKVVEYELIRKINSMINIVQTRMVLPTLRKCK